MKVYIAIVDINGDETLQKAFTTKEACFGYLTLEWPSYLKQCVELELIGGEK